MRYGEKTQNTNKFDEFPECGVSSERSEFTLLLCTVAARFSTLLLRVLRRVFRVL